jgi:hypothetical protein
MDVTPDAQGQQGGKPPLLNIVGEKVALGLAHRDLLPLVNTWDNDFTAEFLGGNVLRPITEGGTEAFLASTSKERPNGTSSLSFTNMPRSARLAGLFCAMLMRRTGRQSLAL